MEEDSDEDIPPLLPVGWHVPCMYSLSVSRVSRGRPYFARVYGASNELYAAIDKGIRDFNARYATNYKAYEVNVVREAAFIQ